MRQRGWMRLNQRRPRNIIINRIIESPLIATWVDITGKPETFTPSAHTHVIADVDGLQAALDAAGGGVVTWASITDKPTTFTPSSHTHAIADVTGLQTVLDGKQPAGAYLTAVTWNDVSDKPTTFAPSTHTHVIADVTGLQTALDGKQAAGSYQPLDSDLTSIAALTTTAFGRSFLDRADAAAGRTLLGLGTLATQSGTFSGTSSGTNSGDETKATIDAKIGATGGTDFYRKDGTWAAAGGGGGGAEFTRINGSSGAAGEYKTLQKLSANSADITSVTPATVMTTTGVGAGTWKFEYTLLFQTAATTTGLRIANNHTGTAPTYMMHSSFVSTGGAAATGIHDGIAASATAGLHEGHAERVLNTTSKATVGVATANANQLIIVRGLIVVTATGSLELKIASEVAGSAVRLMAESSLELTKIG